MAIIAKKSIEANGVVRFAFTNGNDITLNVNDLSQEMLIRCAQHGVSQKGGDSYASAGIKSWTVDECQASVESVLQDLMQGNFNSGGNGSGGIIVEALANVTGKDIGDCSEVYRAMDKDARKALAAHPDINAEVLRIKAERAKAKVTGTVTDTAGLDSLFNNG